MDFKLNFNIPKADIKINYRQKNLFIGSCFAENIGELFNLNKLNALVNPCGIIFNPSSVNQCLQLILNPNCFLDTNIFTNQNVYYSWQHHGKINATNKNDLYQQISIHLKDAYTYLKNTNTIFITFGSAFAYQLNGSQTIVANCHKMPSHLFTKVLLEPTQIIAELGSSIKAIKELNPAINIVLTVSPVRYLKDGLHQNSISKGILHFAVNKLVEKYNLHYFPAYEIVNDELRDYRFYKLDFAHPSDQAIEYVWQRFVETYFSDESILILNQIKEIAIAKKHKILNKESAEWLKFKNTMYNKTKQLLASHPYLNLENELQYFLNQ